jgi:hypothetical protein
MDGRIPNDLHSMVQVIGNRLDQDSKRDGQKRGKAKGLSMLLEAHKKVKILVF